MSVKKILHNSYSKTQIFNLYSKFGAATDSSQHIIICKRLLRKHFNQREDAANIKLYWMDSLCTIL